MTKVIEPMKPCKLMGAYATVSGIRDTLPLLHSPCGCQYYLRACLLLHDGIDPVILTSDITQENVVFGGEERLKESILASYQAYHPKLIAVLGGCAPSLVGDDIKAVADGLQEKIDSKIIAVDCGGFAGDQTSGFRDVTLELLELYAEEGLAIKKNLVNLIGFIPGYDYRWRQDIQSLIRTLALMGVKVNAVLGGLSSFEQLKTVGKAQLNIVLSDIRGQQVAKYLKQRFSTPFISLDILPMGMQCVQDWIKAIMEHVDIDKASKINVNKAYDEALKQFEYIDLALVTTYTVDASAVIVCEPYRAVSLAKFLFDDIGMTISAICATEANAETEAYINGALQHSGINNCQIMTNPDSFTLRSIIDEIKPSIIYGSTYERASAYNTGAGLIRIGYPSYDELLITNRPYMGIEGIPIIMEDLCNAIIQREL